MCRPGLLPRAPDIVVLDPPEVRDAVIAARTLFSTYLTPQPAEETCATSTTTGFGYRCRVA